LALIGATTSIFSIVDGVLLKRLPFPAADRLIAMQSGTSQDTLLAAAFALLATVLAGVGIYGVLASSVAQRPREIGIGAAVGVAAAIAVTRVLALLLFGVSAFDPLNFAVVCLVLMPVVAAAYLPARRATGVDPLVALRAD
jgi:ABC-type antimicrobial peptide transport system permease subunit